MAQPARAGNLFHFLFTATDQALIDETTIVVSDEPYSLPPAAGQPCVQSLRIQFALKDPAAALPQARPLGPGTLTFYPDAAAGRTGPTRATADVANIGTWPTVGTMLLRLDRPEIQTRLAEITGLPVVPSHIWYSKVEITSGFLSTTLPALRQTESLQNTTTRHQATSPERLRDLIVGLFKMQPLPQVREGTTAAGDHLATVAMPTVVSQGGQVELHVTMAHNPPPYDGTTNDFENPSAIPIDDPAHPSFGAIPARHVYRSARTNASGDMANAGTGNAVANMILARDNSTPEYYAVRFTRIWKPDDDCSVHFPSQRIVVLPGVGSYRFECRLPCHGIVFVPVTPIEALAGLQFNLRVVTDSTEPARAMWWLTASTAAGPVPEVWKDMAANLPVPLDLSATAHFVMRRRMSQEIIYDRVARPKNDGAACTYFSMRRAVRAFVNNRIAGGRLNFEVWYNASNELKGRNKTATRKLVQDAIGAAAGNAILDGKPDHRGDPGTEAAKLLPVLEALFSDDVPPATVDGTASPDPHQKYGWVAYYLWQTGYTQSRKTNTATRAFDYGWLGGGGAGALVALGLGDYVVNPGVTITRNAAETDTSYQSRIAEHMLAAGVEPGAALQFWDQFSDLDAIRNRTLNTGASGHSPTFLRYASGSEPRGMSVLDQYSVSTCPCTGASGHFTLEWYGYKPGVWIAANWYE